MKIFKKGKKLVTHDGSFHADDIFACATLLLVLDKKKERAKIFRTRDQNIIKKGDYVFDIGGIYDAERNLFDHHQIGGAGKRPARNAFSIADAGGENNIEYSSFGLVWKKFGEEVCGNKEVADFIDQKLVSPIDADDNGINLYKNNFENILPYTINDVLSIFKPTSLENLNIDKQFLKALELAKVILKREIKKNNDQIEITKIIQNYYKNSKDKRLIIIEKPEVSRYEIWDALQDFTEPLFIVYKTDEWRIVAMRLNINSFENRKNFPKVWAGLIDKEFQKISGVEDAIFCHRGLFLAGAKSKEGAIKLAQIALINN
ncbi:MAG: MYG1 family protein [Patescibacteria group bacterium]